MKALSLSEKIFANFFRNPSDSPIPFSDHELAVKRMYETVFAFLLENPETEDKNIIKMIVNEHDRSSTQAYRDYALIKATLGNVRNANKEWQLYTVIKMCKEAYARAKALDKPKEMIMAADKLGKYTKLDKDELDAIPWEDILPPSFEPSADTTLLNIPNLPANLAEHKRKLREKYIKDVKFDEYEPSDSTDEDA